ncbi:MAG: nucleotidyltransferase domain-containing protein, partial [Thiotrichaceae bacterium]|nr:nucleotidyltransferase domain-containing protein [Thiotrichaceae bacterium]
MPTSPSFKDILKQNNQDLQQEFENNCDISSILKKRSQKIDQLLQELWGKTGVDSSLSVEDPLSADGSLKVSLIAVGGYGREEMHPASDVDLLILLSGEPNTKEQEQLSDFVTILWDLGLEIGHSVRTLDECIEEAKNDLTVITNLIESRYICGASPLFEQLQLSISTEKLWSSADFFTAKIEEQSKRYKRFGDSAYRVEPNLKEGPGGLRDLQTIGWIFLREYGVKSLKKLSTTKEVHLLSPDEYQALIEARDFLWKVRFALHQLTGRKTDRLLFDHQRSLAHSFGFTNDENNESIESFMQLYYRNITELERLNEVLLGLLREHILDTKQTAPIPINSYYNDDNGYLSLTQEDLFVTQPHTLLEVFHIMQTRP